MLQRLLWSALTAPAIRIFENFDSFIKRSEAKMTAFMKAYSRVGRKSGYAIVELGLEGLKGEAISLEENSHARLMRALLITYIVRAANG